MCKSPKSIPADKEKCPTFYPVPLLHEPPSSSALSCTLYTLLYTLLKTTCCYQFELFFTFQIYVKFNVSSSTMNSPPIFHMF